MGTEVKAAWKGTSTTYKLAVDGWVTQAGGLAAAAGGLKGAATVAKLIPYIGMVFDLLDAAASDERMRHIEKQIKELRFYINDIYDRLQGIHVELALIDNNIKSQLLDQAAEDLGVIVKKSREPDVTPRDLKNLCIEVAAVADRFLASGTSAHTGEELPFILWHTSGFSTTLDDPPRVIPVRDMFVTWPVLGLYALTLTTWVKIGERALQGGAGLPLEDGLARARHRAALSTGKDFNRNHNVKGESPHHSLLEYAMRHVTYGFRADARGSRCVLTASVHDTMGGNVYTHEQAEFTQDPRAFCQLYDFHIDADSQPDMLASIDELAGIGMMHRLRRQLTDTPPGRLRNWPKGILLHLYVVDAQDDLHLYESKMTSDLRPPPVWQRAPLRVGNGWGSFRSVFGSGWDGLYAVRPDDSVVWYRHVGQLKRIRTWAGPSPLPARSLIAVDWVEHRFGDDYGGLFEFALTPGDLGLGGKIKAPVRTLWWREAVDPTKNPPTLAAAVPLTLRRKVIGQSRTPNWKEYTRMFAGGGGTFYGIDAGGTLWWHRHVPRTRSVTGAVPLGEGWDAYAHIFAGRDGLVFGVTPDGDMFGHAFRTWRDVGDLVREPRELTGPVLAGIPGQWKGCTRFIPMLGDPVMPNGPK